MAVITLVLLLLALVAFLVAAVLAHRARDIPTSFLSIGLALWVGSVLLGLVPA
jgi:hypothetical protein